MTPDIFVSTLTDGSMKYPDGDFQRPLADRQRFLAKHGISIDDTTLVGLSYGGDDYLRYRSLTEQDRGDGMVRAASFASDAMIVTTPGHALLLPLADCIGAVLYDNSQPLLMLSHLGRHNLEQYGGTKSVDYLVNRHHANLSSIHVWLSPAAGNAHYPLFAFNNRSLHDVAVEQLIAGGVPHDHISISEVDTTTDITYFSHSEYLKGHRDTDGRFAVVAQLPVL